MGKMGVVLGDSWYAIELRHAGMAGTISMVFVEVFIVTFWSMFEGDDDL